MSKLVRKLDASLSDSNRKEIRDLLGDEGHQHWEAMLDARPAALAEAARTAKKWLGDNVKVTAKLASVLSGKQVSLVWSIGRAAGETQPS